MTISVLNGLGWYLPLVSAVEHSASTSLMNWDIEMRLMLSLPLEVVAFFTLLALHHRT